MQTMTMGVRSGVRRLVGTPGRLALALGLWAAVTGLAVWLAPAERTLGDGIKWVYVHVALTWTGMTGLAAAAGLGALLLITGWPRLAAWTRQVGLLGLAFFALGWATSAVASQVNWGGIAWHEPRNQVNLQVLAAGVIVAVAGSWLNQPRWQGALYPLLFAWMLWAFAATPLVLHPRSPIFTSASPVFAAAFLTTYALTLLAALGVLAYWRLRPAEAATP